MNDYLLKIKIFVMTLTDRCMFVVKLIIAATEELLSCAGHIAEYFIYVISDLPKNPFNRREN